MSNDTDREERQARSNAIDDAKRALLAACNGDMTCDELTEFADSIKRADYWAHVRTLAESIQDDARERIKGGTDPDEALNEASHEAVDGSAWVIYTAQNFDVLRYSDNEDAAIDEAGEEGIASRDGIDWARLAFFALRADVQRLLPDADSLVEKDEDAGAEA